MLRNQAWLRRDQHHWSKIFWDYSSGKAHRTNPFICWFSSMLYQSHFRLLCSFQFILCAYILICSLPLQTEFKFLKVKMKYLLFTTLCVLHKQTHYLAAHKVFVEYMEIRPGNISSHHREASRFRTSWIFLNSQHLVLSQKLDFRDATRYKTHLGGSSAI